MVELRVETLPENFDDADQQQLLQNFFKFSGFSGFEKDTANNTLSVKYADLESAQKCVDFFNSNQKPSLKNYSDYEVKIIDFPAEPEIKGKTKTPKKTATKRGAAAAAAPTATVASTPVTRRSRAKKAKVEEIEESDVNQEEINLYGDLNANQDTIEPVIKPNGSNGRSNHIANEAEDEKNLIYD